MPSGAAKPLTSPSLHLVDLTALDPHHHLLAVKELGMAGVDLGLDPSNGQTQPRRVNANKKGAGPFQGPKARCRKAAMAPAPERFIGSKLVIGPRSRTLRTEANRRQLRKSADGPRTRPGARALALGASAQANQLHRGRPHRFRRCGITGLVGELLTKLFAILLLAITPTPVHSRNGEGRIGDHLGQALTG